MMMSKSRDWQSVALAAAMAVAIAPQTSFADSVRVSGTGSAIGTMRLIAQGFAKSGAHTEVNVLPAIGSGGAIKAVLAGALEIALTSRPLTRDERERGAVEFEYARTPFLFATSAGNPTVNITSAELAELYSGKRTAWPDRTPVRLVLRPAPDIDSTLVKGLSPAIAEAVALAERRPGMTFADTDSDAVDAIERLPGSFGTAVLSQLISERRKVKVLKLDGVEPSIKALAEGRYPLSKQLYLVVGARAGPAAREFARFVQSESGKKILEKNGHVVSRPR